MYFTRIFALLLITPAFIDATYDNGVGAHTGKDQYPIQMMRQPHYAVQGGEQDTPEYADDHEHGQGQSQEMGMLVPVGMPGNPMELAAMRQHALLEQQRMMSMQGQMGQVGPMGQMGHPPQMGQVPSTAQMGPAMVGRMSPMPMGHMPPMGHMAPMAQMPPMGHPTSMGPPASIGQAPTMAHAQQMAGINQLTHRMPGQLEHNQPMAAGDQMQQGNRQTAMGEQSMQEQHMAMIRQLAQSRQYPPQLQTEMRRQMEQAMRQGQIEKAGMTGQMAPGMMNRPMAHNEMMSGRPNNPNKMWADHERESEPSKAE